MRDRADLAQGHRAIGSDIELAARFADPVSFSRPKPKGGERAGIGPRRQKVALHAPDAAIEIKAEIGLRVERVVFAWQRCLFDLGDADQRGKASSGVRKNR